MKIIFTLLLLLSGVVYSPCLSAAAAAKPIGNAHPTVATLLNHPDKKAFKKALRAEVRVLKRRPQNDDQLFAGLLLGITGLGLLAVASVIGALYPLIAIISAVTGFIFLFVAMLLTGIDFLQVLNCLSWMI